jgi:hypothetical protein
LKLRVGLAVMAAVAVGLIAMAATSLGKVRSTVVASVAGAVIGAVAIYVMWVVYARDELVKMGFPATYQRLVERPDTLLRVIRLLDDVGTWKLKGEDLAVSGFPLLMLWVGEAGMMLVCGVVFPVKAVASAEEIDCRQCGAACKLVRPILRFGIGVESGVVAVVEGRTFGQLVQFPQPETDDEPQLSVRLVSCGKCGETNVVTVNRIVFELTKEGRKMVIKPVVNRLMISSREAEEMKGVMKEVEERKQAASSNEAAGGKAGGDEGEDEAEEEIEE